MNKYWSGLVAACAMAATVTLAGQGQSPANTPPPDAASPAGAQRTQPAPSAQTRTTGNTVTISGCIQNAPATAVAGGAAGAGATGSAAAGADRAGNPGAAAPNRGATTGSSSYVLANASMAPGANPAANRGAVGTSGAAATYRLEGDASQLSPHVNHQVRITGMLQDSAASATGAANAAPGSTAAGPTLRVETVTMVADTCTGAQGPGTQQNRGDQGAQPEGNRPQGAGGNTTPGSNQGNTTRPQP